MSFKAQVVHARKNDHLSLTERGNTDLTHARILLAEDTEDNQVLIKRVLSKKGASVAVARNGQEAVDLAMAEPFDIILMDIQMPKMDGYEVIKKLRRLGFKKPVLALTAHAMDEEKAKTKAAGFDDHLTKPLNSASLISVIASFLRT